VLAALTLVVALFAIGAVAQPPPPAPDEAVVSAETPCPNVPTGVPSNSCFDYNGLTHICCINPDSCGPLDASGGATCANGQYVLFNAPTPPPTFTLIGADPPCPVCQGAPSNACFSSYGDTKVCCINPSSCDGIGPATCQNDEYVIFSGSFSAPTPINC